VHVIDRDAYLLHQVHPLKLLTDVACGLASTALMWRRRVRAALLVAHLPPVLASAIIIRGDLSRLKVTRRGRYVLEHMPPSAQALRLLGQAIMWRAAYRHRAAGVAAGALAILIGWSHGLLPTRARPRGRRGRGRRSRAG
jgi:hypothetical protein